MSLIGHQISAALVHRFMICLAHQIKHQHMPMPQYSLVQNVATTFLGPYPGTSSKPTTALLARLSRNCNKRVIFWASEMFWVSTISSKLDLNLEYSQELPETLTTSKWTETIFRYCGVCTGCKLCHHSLSGRGQKRYTTRMKMKWKKTWLGGKAQFIKGIVTGFRLRSLTLGSDIAAPPGVELNNETYAALFSRIVVPAILSPILFLGFMFRILKLSVCFHWLLNCGFGFNFFKLLHTV